MKILCASLIILLSLCIPWASAYPYEPFQFGTYTPDQFRDYWYNQGAEISRFSLQQMRYGEIHSGDAVLVFVTEKMKPDLQIKADNPGPDDIAILKLNAVRKFFTGIYPYSILTSIFTPVDVRKYPLPLKITSSTQEWCGHVYLQMNLNAEDYHVRLHSYFEEEGDRDFILEKSIPEDAIWSLIRIAPDRLPRGEFSMIPGSVYTRLAHRPISPTTAIARLTLDESKSLEDKALVLYEIKFSDVQRTIQIFFDKDFPYRIHKWSETYMGLTDNGTKMLTTSAIRTHTIMKAYWRHHGNKDRALLKTLGLNDRELGK